MTTQPKIYLCGAISSDPNYLIKFQRADDMFARFGMEVVNPCKLPHKPNATHNEYIRKDISEMVLCDAIYVMRDWIHSKGAQIEIKVAGLLDIRILKEGSADFKAWLFNRFGVNILSNYEVTCDGTIKHRLEL
jgi:hypothetical protein